MEREGDEGKERSEPLTWSGVCILVRCGDVKSRDRWLAKAEEKAGRRQEVSSGPQRAGEESEKIGGERTYELYGWMDGWMEEKKGKGNIGEERDGDGASQEKNSQLLGRASLQGVR